MCDPAGFKRRWKRYTVHIFQSGWAYGWIQHSTHMICPSFVVVNIFQQHVRRASLRKRLACSAASKNKHEHTNAGPKLEVPGRLSFLAPLPLPLLVFAIICASYLYCPRPCLFTIGSSFDRGRKYWQLNLQPEPCFCMFVFPLRRALQHWSHFQRTFVPALRQPLSLFQREA